MAPLCGLDPELWKNEENSLNTSEHTGAIVSLSALDCRCHVTSKPLTSLQQLTVTWKQEPNMSFTSKVLLAGCSSQQQEESGTSSDLPVADIHAGVLNTTIASSGSFLSPF